ncbi:hypothetical protein PG995_005974 [Apiospora arundinis]
MAAPNLATLPRELIMEIMDHLSTEECFVLSQVSRAFAFATDPGIILSHDARLQKYIARVVETQNIPRPDHAPYPLILKLIANGTAFSILDEAVRVYARHFIACFAGKWGHKDLLAPQFLAAWHGRHDVVERIFQTPWVDHSRKLSEAAPWQEWVIAGEGAQEPDNSVGWNGIVLRAGNAMLRELPGALLYAMWGSHDALALRLVQHYNVHQELTNNTPTVSHIAIVGLVYLAARMNMPQLLRFLLNWGGINLWANQANFTNQSNWANPTTAFLTLLYQIAAQGTRELPYPERLKASRLRTEDSHILVLADVYAENLRLTVPAGAPPPPFQHGFQSVLVAIQHWAPRNAVYILNMAIASGIQFGVGTAGQAAALSTLAEALLTGRWCPDMMQVIREVHPNHTRSWLRLREAREKLNPPPALWHPNLPPETLKIEDHLPSISSRMLSLAIRHGGIEFARYLLQNGAVPDEDHVMQTMVAVSRRDHKSGAQFLAEKSGIIDLLVEHGLKIADALPRRFYHAGPWEIVTLGTIGAAQDLPMATVTPQPMDMLQVAAHECLAFVDDTRPEVFYTYMWNDRQDLLFRAPAFCRIVYHFLREGGRIHPLDTVTRARMLGLGLMFFTARGVTFTGEPRWEVNFPTMMTDHNLQRPDRNLAQNARDGKWRPDLSMLTGRGVNIHEQVLAAVMLLFLAGGESWFMLAEKWQNPNKPTDGFLLS